jgi:hypothetical protein
VKEINASITFEAKCNTEMNLQNFQKYSNKSKLIQVFKPLTLNAMKVLAKEREQQPNNKQVLHSKSTGTKIAKPTIDPAIKSLAVINEVSKTNHINSRDILLTR